MFIVIIILGLHADSRILAFFLTRICVSRLQILEVPRSLHEKSRSQMIVQEADRLLGARTLSVLKSCETKLQPRRMFYNAFSQPFVLFVCLIAET